MGTVRTRRLRDILETLVVSRQFQGSATIGYPVPIRQLGYESALLTREWPSHSPFPTSHWSFLFHFLPIIVYPSFHPHPSPGGGLLMHVSPCLAIAGFLSAAPRPNLFANPRPPSWLYLCRVLPSLLRPTGKLCPGKCIGRDRERPSVHFSK